MPGMSVDEYLKLSNIQISPKALLTSFSNSTQPDICKQTLISMLNHFVTESSSFGEIIKYSGRAVNDLGDYESCKRLSDKYYLLVNLVISGFTLRLGLCLPNNCPYSYMVINANCFKDIISKIIGIKLEPNSLVMIDSAETFKTLSQVTKGLVITLLAIGLIIAITLAATVMDYKEYFKKDKGGMVCSFLWCFSLQRNIKGVLSTANRVDPKLEVFNGIRVLAIAWVVIPHSFYMAILTPFVNPDQILDDMVNAVFLAVIKSGTLAVDVFFFLSGFLAALSIYRGFKIPAKRNIRSFLMTYFHRYVRLLPFLILLMVYTICIQPLLANGPINYIAELFAQKCLDQWYQVLLYYANFFVPFDQLCNGWIWYILVDMQLYIFIPILMLFYCLNKKVFYSFLVLLSLISLVTPLSLCLYYHFNISYAKTVYNKLYDSGTTLYVRPYCRGLAYCLGVMFFVLYDEGNKELGKRGVSGAIKDAVYNRRMIRYGVYSAGVLVMGVIGYSFYFIDAYPNEWNDVFGAFHATLVRPLFIIALGIVLYPVLIGRGKSLLSILGYYIFNPLAKLTYGVYIIHLTIFFTYCMNTPQAEYYSISERLTTGFMILVISYLLSFVFTLMFESPIVQLLKLLTDSRNSKSDTIKALK
jgi:peptidoglycan/LPS O-acetylase OafA/YrhL